MKEIKCMAIDDEPIALQIIESFCRRRGGIAVSCFTDPEEGLAALKTSRPDVLFLDISMPEISGLEIARAVPANTCVVFTTAHIEYALDGFNLDAVDFLHKPFLFERFNMAVEKALRRMEIERNIRNNRTIIVKKEYDSIPVKVNDILYIQAMENYVKIYLENGTCIVSRINMKAISDILPKGEFTRIHRSYIVSRRKVTTFSKKAVTLSTGATLPVGRLYAGSLEKEL